MLKAGTRTVVAATSRVALRHGCPSLHKRQNMRVCSSHHSRFTPSGFFHIQSELNFRLGFAFGGCISTSTTSSFAELDELVLEEEVLELLAALGLDFEKNVG